MSKLIYIANVSLDGYIEDSHGNFDWSGRCGEIHDHKSGTPGSVLSINLRK